MSEIVCPGPHTLAALEYFHGLYDSSRALLSCCQIENEHIAEALRELADWIDPNKADTIAFEALKQQFNGNKPAA